MNRKFKVGDIIHKIEPIFAYRLEVKQIKDTYYIADVRGKFSSVTIYFEDEDKYELVPRNLQYSQHLNFNRNGIIHK